MQNPTSPHQPFSAKGRIGQPCPFEAQLGRKNLSTPIFSHLPEVPCSHQTDLTMSWKETSTGRFERPLDSLESFYRATAAVGAALGKEHLALSISAQLELDLDENVEIALQNAWKTMRYDHPKLAATVEDDMLVYQIPSTSTLDVWLAESFIIKPSTKSTDLFASLNEPPALALLYYLPQTSEIVLHTSHWRIDGVGGLHFLDRFLTVLAFPRTVTFGNEAQNLTPGLDTVLSLPDSVSAEDDMASNKALMSFGMHLPSISVPPSFQGPVTSPITHRQELRFSVSTSAALLRACQARDLGITAATHAALIAAAQQLAAPDVPATNYASWCAVSLRPLCPAPWNSHMYAVAGAHTGVPLAMKPAGFKEDAVTLQKFYKTALADTAIIKGLKAFHYKLTHMLNHPPSGMPPPADPALNSLGVVDRFVKDDYGEGRVRVGGFWLGNAVIGFQLWTHLWSWKGQVTLSVLHNVGVYDDKTVNGFLEKIKDILLRELEVKET